MKYINPFALIASFICMIIITARITSGGAGRKAARSYAMYSSCAALNLLHRNGILNLPFTAAFRGSFSYYPARPGVPAVPAGFSQTRRPAEMMHGAVTVHTRVRRGAIFSRTQPFKKLSLKAGKELCPA
ncbi:MAG: hypothetical protein E4H36_12230 [Spirochaetales bacterium]|nr:MAG: hypothetical protein E4H36_12230 [Spirochaetales bacterium]